MSDFAYTRLTELDRSFLIYEGPNSPMHVGAVQIYDGAPLRSTDGSIDLERIHEYVASRLHHIPRYRQRVDAAPIDGHPIWVDDARFNLHYHIRHTRLPKPGNERILKRTCARILEQRLDLHKPLWELWLVEGLDDGRIALVSKTHHCMIDGVSGVDLMSVLMTPAPTEKIELPPVWLPRRGPVALEYAASEAVQRVAAPLHAARALGRLVSNTDHARSDFAERIRAAGHVAASSFAGATPSPLNQPIGPHRRFDWLPMRLDDVSFVRKRLGGTVNDVVLTVVAGAIRRFFKHVRLTDPDALSFKVMAPVSVRDAGERGRLGNRVAAWFVPLPIDESDPPEAPGARARDDGGDEASPRRPRRGGVHAGARMDGCHAPRPRGAAGREQSSLQHGRDERAGPSGPAVSAGRADDRGASHGAAHGKPLARDRALQLWPHDLLGLHRRLGAHARSP